MFKRMFSKDKDKDEKKKEKERKKSESDSSKERKKSESEGAKPKKESSARSDHPKPVQNKKASMKKGKGRRRKKRTEGKVKVDFSKPIEWPQIPEIILEYHNHKAFLTKNEEWLLVELNEFECMVENDEILRIIAKHSKFFEVDPPELLEEFFEWVDECPAYDEVINFDIWQEFTLAKYDC